MAISISHPVRIILEPLVADGRTVLRLGLSPQAHQAMDEKLLDQAETLWARLHVRGAASLHEDGFLPCEGVRILKVTNPALTIAILGRTRGSLFMARLPFDPHPAHIVRSVITTDPQLIDIAVRVNSEEAACDQ